jgi:NAD/NADP transhydrogenase alpha subunit
MPAMTAVPRISRGQSLDVLSSMANFAGYPTVIEWPTSSAAS